MTKGNRGGRRILVGVNEIVASAGAGAEVIRREVAPYVGISWQQAYGGTADFARAAGAGVAGTAVVAGLRLWY